MSRKSHRRGRNKYWSGIQIIQIRKTFNQLMNLLLSPEPPWICRWSPDGSRASLEQLATAPAKLYSFPTTFSSNFSLTMVFLKSSAMSRRNDWACSFMPVFDFPSRFLLISFWKQTHFEIGAKVLLTRLGKSNSAARMSRMILRMTNGLSSFWTSSNSTFMFSIFSLRKSDSGQYCMLLKWRKPMMTCSNESGLLLLLQARFDLENTITSLLKGPHVSSSEMIHQRRWIVVSAVGKRAFWILDNCDVRVVGAERREDQKIFVERVRHVVGHPQVCHDCFKFVILWSEFLSKIDHESLRNPEIRCKCLFFSWNAKAHRL